MSKTINEGVNNRVGYCYQYALLFVFEHQHFNLVHGYITHPVHGFQIDHAWCEAEHVVYEPTSNQIYVKSMFYDSHKAEVGKIYSEEEARKLSADTDTCGPWHELKELQLEKYYDKNGEIKNEYR